MASSRLPSVLDTDFQSQEAARGKANSDAGAALDLPDGCRESNLGCATNSWRAAHGRVRHHRTNYLPLDETSAEGPGAGQALACVSTEPPGSHRRDGLLRGPD